MAAEILARNILVLEQLEEIVTAFYTEKIIFVLLKGIALINFFPEYIMSRTMEDIDLLIYPGQIEKAKQVLYQLKYQKSKLDPYAFK
ncbi:MAG: nucleotidyltransferase family protein, partial [Elusimicrobiota bacterium]|nr:nucleotidyltransferase family protein [Elusimicrobiota bacterium]